MGARILYRDSQGRDGHVDLDPRQPLYIGRGLECAIRTDDAMVSRKHSMITMEQNRFVVEDLGSSNGTHVNDERVIKQPLTHNDVVRCGSLWLRYVEDGPVVANPMAAVEVASEVSGESAVRRAQPDFEDDPRESSVIVDLEDDAGSDAAKLRQRLRVAEDELEELQNRFDREAAEGKRARAEAATARDRAADLGRIIADRDDMIASHARVAEELRGELAQLREELARSRASMGEVTDSVASRDRQLARAKVDIKRLKEELEDKNRELVQVARTKDEGWEKLNAQLGELEHLREVINEQERMLEERRVGLMSQEAVIKGLRNEKEAMVQQQAAIRAERDELRGDAGRMAAQISAIDEENRRLSELLAELQSRASRGKSPAGDTVALAEELKATRVELRKLEADRDRMQEVYHRAEREILRLEGEVAELEVEVREAADAREIAKSSKSIAEEAMAKAEARAHKAQEEAISAARARDEALAEASGARRDVDKLRRAVDDDAASPRSAEIIAELTGRVAGLQRDLDAAVARAEDAERQLSALVAERDAAKQEAQSYRTGSFVIDEGAAGDGDARDRVTALETRALEVFEDVNDALSALRNDIRLLDGELRDVRDLFKGGRGDSFRIMQEALERLLEGAEESKGVVRKLKELAENDAS